MPQGLVYRDADGNQVEIEADTVVLAVGSTPRNRLAGELEKLVPGRVRLLGDADKPQTIDQAIESGFKAALELE